MKIGDAVDAHINSKTMKKIEKRVLSCTTHMMESGKIKVSWQPIEGDSEQRTEDSEMLSEIFNFCM